MKRILLIGAIALCSFSLKAQQTAQSSLEKAKKYLASDPCNSTGLAWAKGALKLEPNNVEAKSLIKKCEDQQLDKAISTLKQDPSNYKATQVIEKILKDDSENEELNYLVANSYLQKSPSWKVKKHIEKAIDANPNKEEYRYIRVRCNMMMDADASSYREALEDIHFIQKSSGDTGQLYAYEAVAERELAESLEGDEALKHFKLAYEAGEKAVAINKDYNSQIWLSSIENSIKELE